MKLKTIYCIFSAIIIAVCMASCSGDCYVPTKARMGVAFMDSTTLKPYTINGLTVQGVGSDSILYNKVNTSVIYLPLHDNAEQTDFKITIASTVEGEQDKEYIMHIDHTPRPQLISPECGCVMFQTVISADVSPVMSDYTIEIYNAEVKNIENDIHLKIFF
ncbi:MAG TPA: DUF6452 family protein [Candidatus Enterocola sp.]|jgi:hypothetical protein|nr:DUF6452 family protein [Candidatus Enterocola sp.]